MSWPGFYTLSAAWLSILLIPLVIFYFLKLKRPRLEVPSLLLWNQVINDQRVNSPFQKFKRNLLLLLQLLLLACLILAAMQPFIPSGADRVKYLPVLIDCSASMAATDAGESTTRLEQATQQVSKLIDDLLPDQRMSIISVSSHARQLTSFTDNKRLLREAIEKVVTTDLASRVEEGLRLTQALSRTVPIETVILYSDGNVPERIDFDLPFQLQFHRLGQPASNIGITALTAQRNDVDTWHIFAEVMASVAAASGTNVQLIHEGEAVMDDYVELEAGQSKRLLLQVTTESASELEVRLIPDGSDALEADNTAYLRLPTARPLAVYCSESLSAFRHALQAMPGVDLFPDGDEPRRRTSYDLAITDQELLDGIESNVQVTVGVIPEAVQKLVSVDTGSANVVDWKRNATLLQHVQLTDVLISDQTRSADGVSDGDYESLGYDILAHGNTGPLILERRTGDRLFYHILFHTDRSTLGYRVAFPILVANAVRITLQEAALSEVRAAGTGILPPQRLDPDTTYSIVGPDLKQESSTGDDGMLSGIAAPRSGFYKVLEDGVEVRRVAASLLSAQETSLRAVEELQFRELTVAAAVDQVKNDRPLWHGFALGAFCLLLAEWWYFNRPAPIVTT